MPFYMSTFQELGLRAELLNALKDLGYESPTPIQKLAIPQVLTEDRDVIAFAQTGTGKTAAFSLPILEQIEPNAQNIQCIILSPTRELAIQIANDIENYSKHIDRLNVVSVYGGSPIEGQIRQLRRGCDIVVGTPGRTLDLIKRGKLHLESVNWLVLDEADEMLSMGFADDLDAIMDQTPKSKQTLLFSATLPKEMITLSKKYMNDPVEISAGNRKEANTNVHHVYYRINARDRYPALKRAVDAHPEVYGIIFCRTRAETKEVADNLADDGYNTDALHGDLSQAQRDYVMNKFRNRQVQLLIATDVAARGLDVNELTHVINYRLPDEDDVYVHRSGRTGRADNVGVSLTLLTKKEESRLHSLEKKIGRRFDRVPIPGGQEICESQLFHLINNVLEREITNNHIDPFLPQIYEKFENYTKEDIIKRIVSAEFDRFLDYYRNAPDLNKANKNENTRDKGSKFERNRDVPMTRYFISLGKKDGFSPKALMRIINEGMEGQSPAIGQIEILKMFSFFEMEPGHGRELKKVAKNAYFKGRQISIEESSPKAGRSKKRSGKGPKGGSKGSYKGNSRNSGRRQRR